jgi:hypothetical protein
LIGPDEEDPTTYVNYHAFVANIDQCHIFSSYPHYAIWAMRDAFENEEEIEPGSIRDAYVLGAAQWILWNGQNLFAQIRYPGDGLPHDYKKGGPFFSSELVITLPQWRFWRDGFRAVAEEKYEASDECKTVAVKAADMMDALEKNMTF